MLPLGSPNQALHGVDAGVNGLHPQGTFETTPDDEHGRSMHQGPDCQHETAVLPGASAQLSGQALAHQIEGRPRLVQGRRLAYSIKQNLVTVCIFEGKFQVVLNRIAQVSRGTNGVKQLTSRFNAQRATDIIAIAIALINRWCGCAGSLGHGTHGKRFFAATRPQARCSR